MRAAQERSQECLPPKKRDLPPTSGPDSQSEETGREVAGQSPATEGSVTEWARGAVAARPSQTPAHYSEGSAPEAAAAAGLTVDQYGLLYKVAVPPATFSPVVNVSPLSPAFTMTSQLLQHPGIPYSPIHYAPLPSAPLQFVGSHYSVPYTVPPGFLPSHMLPTSPSLAASHIPHFVPYTSLLADDPSSVPAAHSFGKTTLSGPLHSHVGGQTFDVAQSRIPVYYQMSRLPGSYPAFETPSAGLNPELHLQETPHDPQTVTANGVQRTIVRTKDSEALDMDNSKAEGHSTRTHTDCTPDGSFVASSARTEVSVPSQRSTPDTDLEVQRVVGILACSAQSPLNLSHRNLPEQKGLVRDPVEAAEKSQPQRPATKSPEEQLHHRQTLKGLTMANGKLVSLAQEDLGIGSPEGSPPQDPSEVECAHSQSHLPSHFMKGAIIQLATGELKRVEDLQTQDFVRSAEVSGGLKIDSSTVVAIQESAWQGFVTLHFVVGEQQSKVSIDVPPEHPFFVYGQGWSSCSPERTARLFSLPCQKLQVGDVCISISLQSLNGRLAPQASSQGETRERPGRATQSLREPQTRAGEKSPWEKGGVALCSSQEHSSLEPLYLHGWVGPSFQRVEEEPLLRPSFIPQEVKLSIEGRSNAGK